MSRLAALLILPLVAGACGADGPDGPDDRPNVFLLVMDTARGDRYGFNGCRRPLSPRLDALARDATCYRDAWSPSGWTGPAHASLFTGLRPEHHGLFHGNRIWLAEEARTLAEIFRDAGYRTIGVTTNPMVGPEHGLSQGFERFETVGYGGPGPEIDDTVGNWAHDLAREAILEAREAGKPFFAFINNIEPHLPYEPPEPWRGRFSRSYSAFDALARAEAFSPADAQTMIIEGSLPPPDVLGALRDLYDGEIAALDDAVGNLLDWLRNEGILDETLVVVTSDHGENIGHHGLLSHKMDLHRTLRHVPLVVRYPGVFEGGASVDETVRLEDLFPTLLEVCGIAVPGDIDGVSLLRPLGGRIARAVHGSISSRMLLGDGAVPETLDLTRLTRSIAAVYDGRYHLIAWSDGETRLYDVKEDPGEEQDLSGALPEVVDRLSSLLPDVDFAASSAPPDSGR